MNPRIALLLSAFVLSPRSVADGTRQNLALGRSYGLSPPPNYALTTDPGDSVQLTDGQHAREGFWTDKAAVGWARATAVSITVDLGAEFEVTGASFSTAAGKGDVEWPESVLVLGSSDGRSYSALGDLVVDAHAPTTRSGSFARHVYASQHLDGQARFVRLIVGASGPYVFTDEVEVFGIPVSASREGVAVTTDTDALFWQLRGATRLRAEVARRLLEARARVSRAAIGSEDRARLLARVQDLERGLPRPSADAWRSVDLRYPMNGLHADALAVVGEAEHLEGASPLAIWPTNPWDPLDMTTPPPSTPAPAIEVALMNGEVRSAAINVRNSTSRPTSVTVDLTAANRLEPGWIEARPVAWSGDLDGKAVALAVLEPTPSGTRAVLDLPAGVTRQIWVTFAPKGVQPGLHEFAFRASSPESADSRVDARLRVLPGRFPPAPRLHVGGWDYLNDRAGATSPEAFAATAALLQSFGVDLPWATAAVVPHGDYGTDGTLTRAPDTSAFDAWVTRWPRAARYRVFVSASDQLAGLLRGTPAFEAAVRSWATFWASHAASRGISPGNIDLLFVDEPRGVGDDARRQVDWARALNASGSGLRVWTDPVYRDPRDVPPDLIGTAGTVCLNRSLLEQSGERYRAMAGRVLSAEKSVELYGTDGPVSTLDPYAYYRLMAWRAFEVKATGISFWSFTDTGSESSWREYMARRTSYSPLFLHGASVAATKHMYAIREGVEDHEYLSMLRDAIPRCGAGRAQDQEVARARVVLTSAVARVLSGPRPGTYAWTSPVDRSVADSVRVDVAQAVHRLSAGDCP